MRTATCPALSLDDKIKPKPLLRVSSKPLPMKKIRNGALLAFLVFFAACQGVALAATSVDASLPSLGEPANVALSPQKARVIGNQVVGEMYRAHYIVDDPELALFLDSIGWNLASHGSAHPPQFHFFPIADNGINAFALPGANIGVNVGTIVAAQNISELAAVMAHEEAHVTQRHIARTANRSPLTNLASWAAIIAAMIASAGNPNVIMGGLLAGQSLSVQRNINYTRGHEMEADRVGIRTLAKAGYEPMAMADFFGRLQKQTRLYGSIPQLLLNHPVNTTRIAEATERASHYPDIKPPYSITFHLMRARGRVLETDFASDAVKHFKGELESGHDTPGTHYGYAMTLYAIGKQKQALVALKPLLAKWPHQRNVLLLESRIEEDLGKTDKAIAIDKSILKDNPDYTPAILHLAKNLIRNRKPREARAVLLGHHQSYGNNPQTWKLLAQAALAEGDKGEAAFQMATYYTSRHSPFKALDQLNAGLRLDNISDDDRARLDARRKQLIAKIPEDRLKKYKRSRRYPG